MVRFEGNAGTLLLDGVSYKLRQMHWHSPSEHALHGRRYDLELHMLHQSGGDDDRPGSGKYAVVAQLFEIGDHRDETLRMVSNPFVPLVRYQNDLDLTITCLCM
jgi:carbonic anhydrase